MAKRTQRRPKGCQDSSQGLSPHEMPTWGQPALASVPSTLCPCRFFFCSVASALVGLLCVKVLLLYVCIQHFINPSKLRTDPSYKGTQPQSASCLGCSV